MFKKLKSKAKSVASKVKSSAKSYAKNVIGGAKIVGSTIKSAGRTLGKDLTATALTPLNQRGQGAKGGIAPTIKPRIIQTNKGTQVGNNFYASDGRTSSAFPSTQARTGGTTSGGGTSGGSGGTLSPGQFGGAPLPPAPRTLGGGARTSSVDSTFFSPVSTSTIGTSTFNSSSGGVSSVGGSAPSVSMPSAPSYKDTGAVNLAGLASPDGKVNPETGLFDTQGELQQEGDEITKAIRDLSEIPKRESVYENEFVQEQQEEVRRRQQEVNNWQGQLNNIVAKQQQDLLRHNNAISAAGGTEEGWSGRAAVINREAAYAALPIQAQLSTAQGNLELAQDYLKDITMMVKEDLDNDYTYKVAQYNAVKEIADKREKRMLDELEKKETRAYNESQDNISRAWSLAEKAISNKQPALAGKLMNLISNPGSANFLQQLTNLAGQLREPASSGSGSTSAMKEYAFARSQGFEGTFMDYQNAGKGFQGYSGDDVIAIKNDIETYGINKVLQGVTDPDEVAAIKALDKETSKLTRSSISSLFGVPDNNEKSGFKGFFGAGKTNSEKLDEFMAAINQYKGAGYSDEQILKLMQE